MNMTLAFVHSEKLKCPRCGAEGHPHGHYNSGKKRWFCPSCHKSFSHNTIKKYPPTNVPFELIAFVLYVYHHSKRIKINIKKKDFTEYTNRLLRLTDLQKTSITRQTLHHWIRTYSSSFRKLCSRKEARAFLRQKIWERYGDIDIGEPPEGLLREPEPPEPMPISYTQALDAISFILGDKRCISYAKAHKKEFTYACQKIRANGLDDDEVIDFINKASSTPIESVTTEHDVAMPSYEIVNIMLTSKLTHKFRLREIYNSDPEKFEQSSEKFPQMLIHRLEQPKSTFCLYHTSTVVCLGAKSIRDAHEGYEKLIQSLMRVNPEIKVDIPLKVKNMVAIGNFNSSINLNAAAVILGVENIKYEPDGKFKGVTFFPAGTGIKVQIFKSGKFKVVGAKSEEEIQKITEDVSEQLNRNGLLSA